MTILLFILGAITGSALLLLYQQLRAKTFKQMAEQIIAQAEKEATAHKHATELQLKERQIDQQRVFQDQKLQAEKKLERREVKIQERELLLEKKAQTLAKEEKNLSNLKAEREELNQQRENLAGITAEEAKRELLKQVESEANQEAASLILRMRSRAKEEEELRAKKILATVINRLSSPTVSEATVNTITLPNDEIKGRIIGREGRNIRTLERLTGITFLIDDTPGTVVLSGYDPIRLHVAKTALKELLADGRIHPTSIEEAVNQAQHKTKNEIQEFGRDAALRIGAVDLHPELMTLIGKLKFRYSYGQNVLDHSLEVAHLMGMMASELDLDERLAKRIGLLHDMGKAVSHEVEGPHAIIGYNLALKHGESEEVANGIGCHHGEMEPRTIEGSLCNTADSISASRPGARVEAIEEYIKRMNKLEQLAHHFPGVEQVYALQAGREIRVIVLPEMIDDAGTLLLARDISRRIEKDLRYPGKIKVTVIREKRVVEYAV